MVPRIADPGPDVTRCHPRPLPRWCRSATEVLECCALCWEWGRASGPVPPASPPPRRPHRGSSSSPDDAISTAALAEIRSQAADTLARLRPLLGSDGVPDRVTIRLLGEAAPGDRPTVESGHRRGPAGDLPGGRGRLHGVPEPRAGARRPPRAVGRSGVADARLAVRRGGLRGTDGHRGRLPQRRLSDLRGAPRGGGGPLARGRPRPAHRGPGPESGPGVSLRPAGLHPAAVLRDVPGTGPRPRSTAVSGRDADPRRRSTPSPRSTACRCRDLATAWEAWARAAYRAVPDAATAAATYRSDTPIAMLPVCDPQQIDAPR